jgi:hypothetical protein
LPFGPSALSFLVAAQIPGDERSLNEEVKTEHLRSIPAARAGYANESNPALVRTSEGIKLPKTEQ